MIVVPIFELRARSNHGSPTRGQAVPALRRGSRLSRFSAYLLLCTLLTLCLSRTTEIRAEAKAKPTDPSARQAPALWVPGLEVLIPGAGLAVHGRFALAATMATLRLATAFAYVDYRRRALEYRSAERAALVADYFYGPGVRYLDPYSGDYLTSEQFGRRADRRTYISTLAMTVHLGMAVFGAIYSWSLEKQLAGDNLPIFDLAPESSAPTHRNGSAARFNDGFRLTIGFRQTLP